MNVDEIAWLDLVQSTYWLNENCSRDLTEEASLMLAGAEYCSQTFDWDLFQQDFAFGCDLFEQTVWYRAADLLLGMSFGWDRGHSWLPEYGRQLQWKEPWIAAWYDAARPFAVTFDKRLLWTWVMQHRMVTNWPTELASGEAVRQNLEAYLRLPHPAECVPPTNTDCIIEIRIQKTSENESLPVRLAYRKRAPDEIDSGRAGVTLQWR